MFAVRSASALERKPGLKVAEFAKESQKIPQSVLKSNPTSRMFATREGAWIRSLLDSGQVRVEGGPERDGEAARF